MKISVSTQTEPIMQEVDWVILKRVVAESKKATKRVNSAVKLLRMSTGKI